jgi:hypothetical protein
MAAPWPCLSQLRQPKTERTRQKAHRQEAPNHLMSPKKTCQNIEKHVKSKRRSSAPFHYAFPAERSPFQVELSGREPVDAAQALWFTSVTKCMTLSIRGLDRVDQAFDSSVVFTTGLRKSTHEMQLKMSGLPETIRTRFQERTSWL